ncbi:class I SAM-dependent methyltransferase [Yinghuangia seranimata]|uniref:class I SAM-dependent methyltransferase n=1 Tax=Yinghuangia seranimata TaxID=408067 RepID=UPI00248AAADA|nr:class I SAM-dependent methyltransferase [Yinghuangia seranimata]MDI2127555.1 class I SAM-dependent methyltransferase [Yinghuangia seranimata]
MNQHPTGPDGGAGDDPAAQAALAAAYWDAEFAAGRFLDMAPDAFVDDVLGAARTHGLLPGPGLYIGPGNGRNLLPLVAGGLDLLGLDVSATALAAIRERAPERAGRLAHGDLSTLRPDERFPVVVGINVFQHGDRDTAHAHIRAALERVAPGGLFALRVNAVGTRVGRPHEIAEEHPDGSHTIRYTDADAHAPGLLSHYFSGPELAELLADREPVLPLTLDDVDAVTRRPGAWRRWQAVVRRPNL